ncbi:MAG: hypothetical protein HY821_22445, partial [Acidobacteria bacterium]|nr:hypothetical protein [Acidobacteriota bacterium]
MDAQLRDILDSEFFVHSDRLRRLLEFVVEQSLAGNRDDIKEYSIGLAVFDRSPNYDPRIDPIVRVEAGRLRTRLKQFYTSPQGSAAPIIIDLPKGSYFAAVHRREDLAGTEPPAAALPHRPWLYLLAGALLVLAVLTAFLLVSNHALRTQIQAIAPLRATQQVASVWGPVVSSEGETVVIFGSPLFYESEKEYLFVRPYSLPSASSAADSAQFQRLRKQLSLLPDPRYEYAQIGDATALHRLGQFLGKYGVRSKAVPAHLATWESIKDCNIICVGAERMIPLLQRLPVQLDFSFRPDFDVDNRNPRPGEPQKYSTPSHRDAMSYAVIA